jgi:hypothetical protein
MHFFHFQIVFHTLAHDNDYYGLEKKMIVNDFSSILLSENHH